MTYYEELGLDRTASADQIRHAYRRLARLLHPDQCTDSEVRGLAEIQMKRLNHMLAVLTDERERRAYDESLDGRARPPVGRAAGWERPIWGLAAAAVLVFAVAIWNRNRAPAEPAPIPAGPPGAPIAAERTAARKPLRPGRQVRTARTRLPPATDPAPQPVRPATPVAQKRTSDFGPPPAPASRVPEPLPAPAAAESPQTLKARLSGTWLYASAVERRPAKGLYAPEFIEVRLMERSGVVRGRYRSRYAIPDQAISPTVNFEFEGPVDASQLPWKGPSGARGEVSLKLLSESLLEVRWTARHLSPELALSSGTATLIRDRHAH